MPQSDWWQHMPWFGMFMGPVMMVLFIVIAFLVIVPLMRAMGMGRRCGTATTHPTRRRRPRSTSSTSASRVARSTRRSMRRSGASSGERGTRFWSGELALYHRTARNPACSGSWAYASSFTRSYIDIFPSKSSTNLSPSK